VSVKLFKSPPLSNLTGSNTAPTNLAGSRFADATKPHTELPRRIGTPPALRPKHSLPEAPKMLRIVPIPRMIAANRWQMEGMRAQSEAVLLWITRGQGRVTMGGTTRGYGTHNAVFIPEDVMHALEIGPQTQGVAIFFGQNSDVTLPHSAQHLRIRDATPQAEILGIIEQIQRELSSEKIGADRAARHYIGLLGVWLERQVEAASMDGAKPNAAKRLAARFSALLERDFRSGHGVGDYAEALGVTPTHLTRACRESCARSASNVLQDRRHYEACRLLTETDAPVKDVAATLGFSSAAYFTRAFHQRTGKTPSDFRKRA
jgi:AraC-like DNA-binding protein